LLTTGEAVTQFQSTSTRHSAACSYEQLMWKLSCHPVRCHISETTRRTNKHHVRQIGLEPDPVIFGHRYPPGWIRLSWFLVGYTFLEWKAMW